jgi:hypothetical protein
LRGLDAHQFARERNEGGRRRLAQNSATPLQVRESDSPYASENASILLVGKQFPPAQSIRLDYREDFIRCLIVKLAELLPRRLPRLKPTSEVFARDHGQGQSAYAMKGNRTRSLALTRRLARRFLKVPCGSGLACFDFTAITQNGGPT